MITAQAASMPRPGWLGWLGDVLSRDVVLTLAARLIIIFAGFAASVMTARFLRAEGRGEYVFVVTLAQVLAQFANFGLQSSNTYLVARDRSLLARLVGNSGWVALVAGGGGALVVIAAMHALSAAATQPPSSLWFAAALAPVSLFYLLGTNLLVGIKAIAAFNLVQVASNLGLLVLMIAAGLLGLGANGFLTASVAAWSLSAVGLLAILRHYGSGPLAFDPHIFRSGFGYALKAYLATLFGFLALRANVFLLKGLQGYEQLGYFSVATQIGDVMAVVPQSIALVLFPGLVASRDGGWIRTLRSLATVGGLLAAGCVGVGLLAEPFIRTVFGDEFLPAVPMLRWLLPGIFFLGLTAVLSQYLAAGGFPRSLVLVWLAAFLAVTALSRLLIPIHAGEGAAMALSLAHAMVFVLILCASLAMQGRGCPSRRPAAPPDAAAYPS